MTDLGYAVIPGVFISGLCKLALFAAVAHRAAGLDLLEEVVTLVVYEDERREILHLDFPDSFHAKFGIFETFNALD